MNRCCLLIGVVAVACASSRALAASPAPNTAAARDTANESYQLSVVLRYSDDPVFTRFFKDATERQVRDQLAACFGSMVELKVSREHPLLERFAGVPLPEVKASAELFTGETPGEKIVVVELDRRQNLYSIRWRQFDSEAWRIGPIREQTTPDRQWVVKAICRAVTRDFEPVATLEPSLAEGRVELKFRGETHQKELSQMLTAGCVLLPMRIEQQPNGPPRRTLIPDTVLILDKFDGSWHAQTHSGMRDPWRKSPCLVGFQAVKAATATGRVRLKIVDKATGAPALGFTVHASSKGFHPDVEGQLLSAPDRFGYVVSPDAFSNLAFLTISQGGNTSIRVPAPITGAWCEIECRVPIDKQAAEQADFERRLRLLIQDGRALQSAQGELIHDVNELNHAKRYEEALARVKETQGFVSPLRLSLEGEGKRLGHIVDDIKKSARGRLDAAIETVASVGRRETELDGLAANLQKTITRNDAQTRSNVLIDLAKQAEGDADIDGAITQLTQALAEQPEQPSVKQYLADLQETWRIKNPEHQTARIFITDKWAATPVTELAANWATAQQSLQTLKTVNDYLTALKLLKVNQAHIEELTNLNSQLTAEGSDANRAEQEKYAKLTDDFSQFQEVIASFIQSANAARQKTPAPATEPAPADSTE